MGARDVELVKGPESVVPISAGTSEKTSLHGDVGRERKEGARAGLVDEEVPRDPRRHTRERRTRGSRTVGRGARRRGEVSDTEGEGQRQAREKFPHVTMLGREGDESGGVRGEHRTVP